jgi:hypothetical protein
MSSIWLEVIARFTASACVTLSNLSDQRARITFTATSHEEARHARHRPIYIDGQFVTAHGKELLELYNAIAEMHQS